MTDCSGVDVSESTCAVPGCLKPKRTRGWCGPHYQRWRRTGDPLGGGADRAGCTLTAEEALRFYGWTVTPSGCWEWQGGLTHHGYGSITHGKIRHLAHRFAYNLWVGEIPEGQLLRHRCDNPPCINPAHLTPGLHVDNTRDAIERRRFANGTRSGTAKLTDAQVQEIRERKAAGESAKDLALEFGVHFGHVQALAARRFRKAPTNPPIKV